jgi:mono/diheme cytochrome c family protein
MGARVRTIFVALVLLSACGGTNGTSCPNDLPPGCPSPVPSYQNQVASVIASRCVSCHGPGGQNAALPFTTYQQVFNSRIAILNQVYHCVMPPAGNPAPDAQQRALLLGWLVCGAPDN